MQKLSVSIGTALFCGVFACGVAAQDTATPIQPGLLSAGGLLDNPDPDLVLSIGAGLGYSPAYPGSGDMEFGPSATFRFDFVRFPNGLTFGSSQSVGFEEGFGLRGSGRYIGARKSADHPELAGLNDVDWTLELGMGVGYERSNYRVFGDVRYGFHGHEGFVGQIGGDLIARPVEGLTLRFGPRVDFGDSNYSNAYFGITPAESLASGLPAYSAGSGLVSAGLEFNAIYQFNPRWGIQGRVRWNRLLGDVADSPITLQGDDDQLSISVNLVRRISLNF
jgi:outer membrane scaffolding protein for murein synthesis (MipA/OmpV family)